MKNTKLWIFDLDNTLYAPETGILKYLIEEGRPSVAKKLGLSIEDFNPIAEEYKAKYGALFRGIHLHQNISVEDAFNDVFETAPLDKLEPMQNDVKEMIKALPGKKIVFSNSIMLHIDRILDKMDAHDVFDAKFDVSIADYIAKPIVEGYQKVLKEMGNDASEAVMVEDTPKNLITAHSMGMKTALVYHPEELKEDYVHYQTNTLQEMLHIFHKELNELR